ncbi:MAG: siroheme decarboxylase subunit beta [Gammaproteobacteria bacterium]
MNAHNAKLIEAIQDGIPIAERPYACIAERLGLDEADVIDGIRGLLDSDVIKRFGVVVSHRELGYRANAMVVWDIPDDGVDETGTRMAAIECVTLCYRRARRPPNWPYNLYCMIHGRDRASVLACVETVAAELSLENTPRAVLFSKHRFKQRGARYVLPPRLAEPMVSAPVTSAIE